MIADSTVLIDYLRGTKAAVELIDANKDVISITALNKFEILVGVVTRDPSKFERRHRDMLEFLSDFLVVDLSDEIVARAALVSHHMNKTGRQIQDIDCFLAGAALATDKKIITRNKKHFEHMPGLQVITY